MAKIVLTSARDIALDKLVASDANVRRIKAGVSVEDLAEDIARRGLLQSLNVRPELDGEGAETGRFTVTAGGRRLAALKLLVKQKRLAKNAPVPCIVKADGIEEEDSLAENTMREALHPLDQFRAFERLLGQGLAIEEIAARFFVSAQVVRQRLKLAAASPKLLDLYVAEEMTPRTADGLHRHRGSRAPGAGLGKPVARLQQGAAYDPAHVDRGRGQNLGSPRCLRRRRGL